MEISFKLSEMTDLVFEGSYPSDVFLVSASLKDRALTDREIDFINDNYPSVLTEMFYETVILTGRG